MGGTMAVAMCLRPSKPLNGLSGCMEMHWMAGLSSRNLLVAPMKVPEVPRPATKWVMRPAVCSQISLAVPW